MVYYAAMQNQTFEKVGRTFVDWGIPRFRKEHEIQSREWRKRLLRYPTWKKMRTICKSEAWGCIAMETVKYNSDSRQYPVQQCPRNRSPLRKYPMIT